MAPLDCIAVSSSESTRRAFNKPLTLLGDVLQHRLALIEGLAVGEADDGVAEFAEVRRAGLIVFDLLGVGIAPLRHTRSSNRASMSMIGEVSNGSSEFPLTLCPL